MNYIKTELVTALAALACLCRAGQASAAEVYNIDPAHSRVGFAVSHMVINTVHGKFDEFGGSFTLEGNALQAASGTIQTKSIDTGIGRRDAHLQSPDFFEAAKYPTITFQSKRVEKRGEQTILVGDFTMHGVTKEVALPVTVKGPIKDSWGHSRIGVEVRAKLNRREYGLKYAQVLETGAMVVGDEIEIEINAEAVKADTRAAAK